MAFELSNEDIRKLVSQGWVSVSDENKGIVLYRKPAVEDDTPEIKVR